MYTINWITDADTDNEDYHFFGESPCKIEARRIFNQCIMEHGDSEMCHPINRDMDITNK